ncbi:MAG: DHH family phosphoesterase [Alphaproteobacteria bacterium]|nr:DHH family phosphoesterase [Alphaproteobacteria bacterium]
MKKEYIELFIEKIKTAKSIAIAGHKNPDGDSVCSSLALMKLLDLNFNKKATVIYDGNIPQELENIPLRDDLIYYANLQQDLKYDLFIAVDYGTKNHLGNVEVFVNNSDYVVEFDHHYNDDVVGSLCFDDPERDSTGQLIYDFIQSANLKTNQDIIDLLTLSIISDTGSFKFAKTGEPLRVVADLVDSGADMTQLVNLLNNKKKKTVLMESRVVSNAEFHMRGRLALAIINREDYKKLDGRGDVVLNLLAQIHNVEYVVLLKEHGDTNQIGLSFRSRHNPINKIAESFGGGGHLCAAGAVVEDTLENVHDSVIKAFKGM